MSRVNETVTGKTSPFQNVKRQVRHGEDPLPPTPSARTMRDVITQLRQHKPNAEWLTLVSAAGDRVSTVRELTDRIADYCRLYEDNRIGQGETILIVLRESVDLFASFLAGIIYGALPAYFAYPSPKQSTGDFLRSMENLIEYNDIRLVVTFDEVAEVLQSDANSIFAESKRNAEGNAGRSGFVGCFVADRVAKQSDVSLPIAAEEAFLQFSSGTTGAKKGVKISSQALFRQLDAYRSSVQFNECSRVVSWLPHYHDMGLIACMLMPICESVPIVMMSPFSWVRRPAMLLEAIARCQGTHVWLPNFALGHMAKSVADAPSATSNLSSVEQIICCSEPVLRQTVERFETKFSEFGLKPGVMRACYAMAENTFAMTTTRGEPLRFLEVQRELLQREGKVVEQTGGKSLASVGRPLENIQLKIIDSHLETLEDNRIGEVCIRSDCMLDCYHNNPTASASAISDGWFRTGDLGFLRNGELFITGRKKNIIIVGGENIYPQDIQLVLNEQPNLIPGRSVVFGVHDDRVGTQRIVVLAEAQKGYEGDDTTAIKQQILGLLNISVSTIQLLPHRTLKKGTAGKISNFLNKQEYLDGAFEQVSQSSQDGSQSRSVLDVVRSVLPAAASAAIERETRLMSSGVIDSFGFADLVLALEQHTGATIPQSCWVSENFETVACIEATLERCKSGMPLEQPGPDVDVIANRRASLASLREAAPGAASRGGFWEWAVNHCPIRGSWAYRFLLRRAGVHVGQNVVFLGGIHLKIRGRASNIRIGDNVVLGDRVDLRNRENGRIELADRTYLDQNVRLVAAREGCVEIAFGAELGANTVVNSGGETRIGQFTLIASNVNINSSSHGVDSRAYIKSQAHQHGSITVGDDVWIGSGASILLNTQIGDGAIVSSNSVVNGVLPRMAIAAGVPARVIKYRSSSAA